MGTFNFKSFITYIVTTKLRKTEKKVLLSPFFMRNVVVMLKLYCIFYTILKINRFKVPTQFNKKKF